MSRGFFVDFSREKKINDLVRTKSKANIIVSIMSTKKSKAAKISIASVSLLILLKVVASIITGSISIRADAIHSVIDLLGVIVGYVGIRISDRPPDEQHAFGHGKVENIASFIIGVLIFIAAGSIFYEAVRRLIVGSTIELITVGIYVTAVAIAINGATSWYALRVARSTNSAALEATAHHMFADVLSSCAVLVGLISVRLTGLSILDPIVALLVAILITRNAYFLMKRSLGDLIDIKLPAAEENVIRSCFQKHESELVGFHKLRTRRAGSQRYVDLHLVIPKHATVEEAHQLCDRLEVEIKTSLPDTSINIHVEPCSPKCDQCPLSCKEVPDKTLR